METITIAAIIGPAAIAAWWFQVKQAAIVRPAVVIAH